MAVVKTPIVTNNKIYIIGGAARQNVHEFDSELGDFAETVGLQFARMYPMSEIIYTNSLYYIFVMGGKDININCGDTIVKTTEIAVIPGSPSSSPTFNPTTEPTTIPTRNPTNPTVSPTTEPTIEPTNNPTTEPTTFSPTNDPTSDPTSDPTVNPTIYPTIYPTDPTNNPTIDPTVTPSSNPTIEPTISPSSNPTNGPTSYPTTLPTINPTTYPTNIPTTNNPTFNPTPSPTGLAVTEVFDIVLNGDFNDLETYLEDNNIELGKFALKAVEELMDLKSNPILSALIVVIIEVHSGSIVIEYSLTSKDNKLLNVASSNIKQSVGDVF
eukprot:174594_1